MRTAHWRAHLLPLLLLSLYSVSVCLAATCRFDEFEKNADVLHLATAKEQLTSRNWEPIRIVASTKDIEGPPKYCGKSDGSIHERGSQGAASDCAYLFDTTNPEKKKILMGILGRAIALHTDRLLVQRAVGPLVIPDFSTHPFCKLYNVPAEHCTDGVANADMVLYVASGRDSDEYGASSLGMTCAKSAGGRPIAGSLFFAAGNKEISRLTVRLAAHQIAHALGFSYNKMKSRDMIMYKNVRDKPNPVALVKSDKTKEMTQEHYGCPIVAGMELEDSRDAGDGGGTSTKLSHWERRNAKDELMAQLIGGRATSFMGFYTNLTMAAFEDMGFYKANFQMAEHMEYGHNTGCEFLDGKCMVNDKTKWPNMFCDVPVSTKKANVCTTDRLGLGFCALKDDYSSPLPVYFQYFTSNKKGGFLQSLTDYCPVVEQHPLFLCSNPAPQGSVPGSLFGRNSMCLDGKELKVKTSSDTVPVDAVCAEISCEGGSVKVKYLGDPNKWHDCPEGKSLTPSSTSDSFVSGTIKCPKYKEVCTVAPDGISLVPKVKSHGQKDGSSVLLGLIPTVVLLVLLFAGFLIA